MKREGEHKNSLKQIQDICNVFKNGELKGLSKSKDTDKKGLHCPNRPILKVRLISMCKITHSENYFFAPV